MAHDPYDPRCEKIRALRTELLLRRELTDRADIVALLSPCPGEGRSLLAAELAIAFAQTGRPTLLVDADLRRPQQHLLFGTDNRQGLSQAIEHGVKPQLHYRARSAAHVGANGGRGSEQSAGVAVKQPLRFDDRGLARQRSSSS